MINLEQQFDTMLYNLDSDISYELYDKGIRRYNFEKLKESKSKLDIHSVYISITI